MTDHQPDFLVIGAMKCATTTLHEQFARQPGVFMSRPKEPNFFSDDEVFGRGWDWYASLFEKAPAGALCGESSTHYTKRPTHPRTVERMVRALPRAKLIYVMRHPIERLLSHYVHERTDGRVDVGLHEAVSVLPELVDYGRYAMQLEPYLDAYGRANVLPVFFRRLVENPREEFERIGRFLGCPDPLRWDESLAPQNVGSDRLRRSALREALTKAPVLTPLRQRLLPKALSEPIKGIWRSATEPPPLSPDLMERLSALFDDDLAHLGDWLGIPLTCASFRELSRARSYDWV